MQQRRQGKGGWSCPAQQAAAVLMVLGSMMALLPEARAADNGNVEGANGVLRVHGALTESACRLEMASAYQDVWLGKPVLGAWRKLAHRARR